MVESFTDADMEATDAVLRLAYNTERSFHSRIRRHLYVQPGGSFVARLNGRVVGFGACTDYERFSYIGLMATLPEAQGQGVGRRVLHELLSWLESRRCPTILLDATPAGVPLYDSSGFIDDDSTLVLGKEGTPISRAHREGNVSPISESIFQELVSFDAPIFGAPRALLLRSYLKDAPDRFIVSRGPDGAIEGFLVAQERTIGPWCAINPSIAEKLLSGALELSFDEAPQVSVSGSNADALGLLGRFGFKTQRILHHMCRGERIRRARATMIFGQASLGFG